MIYIYAGTDTKKRNASARVVAGKREHILLPASSATKEMLYEYAGNAGLFETPRAVIVENFLRENEEGLTASDLDALKNSETLFIFLEDKLLAADEKKYKKYAEAIEKFDEKAVKPAPKFNAFAVADAFARKDKIGAWTLYLSSIEAGAEPEAISGMLFWKIKTMILANSRVFPMPVLKKYSSELVALYHKAHRGECDFTIGLEQFILSSLS